MSRILSKIIMKTSTVVKAVEDMEQQRDHYKAKFEDLETENAKLRYQLQIKELNNPKAVAKTYSDILNSKEYTQELQEIHDGECQ